MVVAELGHFTDAGAHSEPGSYDPRGRAGSESIGRSGRLRARDVFGSDPPDVLLLVGFVNQLFAPELSLGVVDTESGAFGYASGTDLAPIFRRTRGVNGLVRHRGHFIVGFQSAPTRVAVLDAAFQPVAAHEARGVVDLHSFAEHDGRLYCASTGTDEVHALDFAPGFDALRVERVKVRTGARPGEDRHHVNSIASVGGDLVVTEFGPKHANGWGATTNGAVRRVADDRVLKDGLHHPHTLRALDGGFALCESGRGRVHLPDGRVIDAGGYVRGLDVARGRVVVGRSALRLRSRSAGTMNAGVATRPELARSAILVHRFDTLALEATVDLGSYGTEVYEVVALDDDSPARRWLEASPLALRVAAMQEQILALESAASAPASVREVAAAIVGAGAVLDRFPRLRRAARRALDAVVRPR